MPLWFNWLVTDHFCHLALFIMLTSLREFVMIFRGWSFVQSYYSLQFEKAWAYHVFLQGAGYPVLHHWVRSLQQRGLGQITADWDDGRQLTDDKWRMAYYRLQNSWQAGAKRKQYGEENAYYDYPDKNPIGWILSKRNRFTPVSFSAGKRQFATNDKRNRNRFHPQNIPSSTEYPNY